MRNLFSVMFVFLLLLITVTTSSAASTKDAAKILKVALLLAPSGKGDKSYNDMALQGIQEAEKGGKKIIAIDMLPAKTSDYNNALKRLAQDKYDIIIAVGFLYVDAVTAISEKYPKCKFVIIDGNVPNRPNVRSITFNPEEGSFLVGVAAGMASTSPNIGFIAGMDIPIMNRFACGFRGGVKYASQLQNRQLYVKEKYIGSTPDSFSNPAKGRDMALMMYKSGVDVIYHAAALSGNGVIQAAKETNKLVIGVDIDQSRLAPNNVLTSMIKRIDVAVLNAITDVASGHFAGGEVVMKLQNGGIGYVTSKLANQTVWEVVSKAKFGLLSGKMTPCN